MKKQLVIITIALMLFSAISFAQTVRETNAEISKIGRENFFTRIFNSFTGRGPSGEGVLFDILVPGTGQQLAGKDYHRTETVKFTSRLAVSQRCGQIGTSARWNIKITGPDGRVADNQDKAIAGIIEGSGWFADFQYSIPADAKFG